MSDKTEWHLLAGSEAEISFSEGGLAEVEAGGKKLCVARFKETLYAFSASCPHAGGSLAGGYTDALGNIVCPLHRYKFAMQSGRNTSGEGYYLKTYALEKRPEGIFIQIRRGGLSGLLK